MILADIDYQEQYSPSKWSTRMSADEIVPAHVEQVNKQFRGSGREFRSADESGSSVQGSPISNYLNTFRVLSKLPLHHSV